MLGYNSKGDVCDRVRLETIFRSRFSSPNIEDEYSYNLSYLISHNFFGRSTEGTHATKHNDAGLYKAECPTHSISSLTGKYKGQLDYMPVKQPAEFLVNGNTSKGNSIINEHDKHVSSKFLRERSNAVNFVLNGKLRNKDHGSGETVLRNQVVRKAFVSAHQPSESQYPGLHIYVTESPPRPFYEVTSSLHPSTHYFPQKTVACDPITTKPKPTIRQRKYSGKSVELKTKESKSQKGEISSSSCLNANSIPSVASRIEALFSTMHVHDECPNSDHLNVSSLPQRDQDLLSNSVDETNEYCFTCCKRTYAVDRIVIGDRTYHKGCFRCTTCLRTLLPGTFASLDGVILCKPHYIEQFRRTGRYEVRKSLLRCDDSDPTSTGNISCEE